MNCGSVFETGASGLPDYYTPPVCIPDVLGVLAVWRQNNQKNKNDSRRKKQKTKRKTTSIVAHHHQ